MICWFAEVTNLTVGSVVSFGALADLRVSSASRNRSGIAQRGLRVAPGVGSFPAQRFGYSTAASCLTVITLGVLAFLFLCMAAGLRAGLAVAAFDVPATRLRFSGSFLGRTVLGFLDVGGVSHGLTFPSTND